MLIEDLADELEGVREAVGEIVVGYDEVVTDLLVGLISGGHVLLVGVPGVAKTTMAKAFARATGLDFGRVQFTQDMLPADITGHFFYDRGADEFDVRKGPVFANLLLADEINRAPPKTQSALLEAMQEGQVTIEGDTFPLPSPFLVIATLNPVDVEGVYHLPEAQLDRFTLRTTMEYLDADTERAMLAHTAREPGEADVVLSPDRIQAAQEAAASIVVADPVIDYIQAIGEATRHHPSVELGASPRAMEQLMNASRAHALLEARDYVIPEDVKRVAERVLAHRLILDVDAEVEGKTDVGIVRSVLEDTPVPKGIEEEHPQPASPDPQAASPPDGDEEGITPAEARADADAEEEREPQSEPEPLDEDGQQGAHGPTPIRREKRPPAPTANNDHAVDGQDEAIAEEAEDGDQSAATAEENALAAEAEGHLEASDEDAEDAKDDEEKASSSSVTFKVQDIFDDW